MEPVERMGTGPSSIGIDEIVQALKARAGFETLYPTGTLKGKVIEYVSRLRGDFPDAYDVIGAGAWLEHNRVLKEKALDTITGKANGAPDAHPFEWNRAVQYDLLRSLMDLTISMRGGKGRREGVEISKTAPVMEGRRRWSWGGSRE